jgi:flagellar basal-body rod protein FlgF
MDVAGYTTLSRQSGLMREMQVVAQNIANASTTGFRREGMIFAEHVARLDGAPSVSMANGNARHIDLGQGNISQTNGTFDFAIEGEGFFLVETPGGQRLTRAGSFLPNAEGELMTPDGHRLLDQGGAPVFVPPDARAVSLARDGTLSADGQPLTRIGLWAPTNPLRLSREEGARFASPAGVEPLDEATILQGFVEESNVDPVGEITRMIEVQRAYEMGQGMLDREDERIRAVIRTLGS